MILFGNNTWDKFFNCELDKSYSDMLKIYEHYLQKTTLKLGDTWEYQYDLPGVDPKTVKVSVDKKMFKIEYDEGKMGTSVPFDSDTYDTEKLQVLIKYGRLTATAPRKPNTSAREIKVKIQE